MEKINCYVEFYICMFIDFCIQTIIVENLYERGDTTNIMNMRKL